MKVCIVSMTGLYPVEIGGPASVSYYLSRELGSLGDEVVLLTRARTEEQLNHLKNAEEIRKLKNVQVQAFRIDYSFTSLLNLPLMAYKIRETMKRFEEQEHDIVHYNSPPVDAAILLPIRAKKKHEKQTLAIHGGLFYESKNLIGRNIIKREKSLFERVVVLNGFSMSIALKAGIEKDRIVTIPNGVDLEALERAEALDLAGDPKILFTGRLTKVKGVEVLIEAFKQVVEEHRNARLYIVGDGPLKHQLENFAKSLGVDEKTSFLGFLPNTNEVYSYYKSADLLVLPSLIENFSITLLEAMGSRLPVIASDVEGNKEIVQDGENGTLFECGNPIDLAEKMLVLLSNPAFRKAMADRAYEDVKERFTWSRIAHSYRKMFKTILDENRN